LADSSKFGEIQDREAAIFSGWLAGIAAPVNAVRVIGFTFFRFLGLMIPQIHQWFRISTFPEIVTDSQLQFNEQLFDGEFEVCGHGFQDAVAERVEQGVERIAIVVGAELGEIGEAEAACLALGAEFLQVGRTDAAGQAQRPWKVWMRHALAVAPQKTRTVARLVKVTPGVSSGGMPAVLTAARRSAKCQCRCRRWAMPFSGKEKLAPGWVFAMLAS
jgi:hypothetical protein